MTPSGKRYLHHCLFRSEKNQRTGDKLFTLMKKVCQLSPFSPVHELSSCQKRKSSREMENERIWILLERQKEQILADVRRVQESRVDESSTRRLIENKDTINELSARIQELQNEVNCLNDSRDFKDAESVSMQWTIPRSQSTSVTPTFS